MSTSDRMEIYNADALPVRARGISYSQEQLEQELRASVTGFLRDDAGADQIRAMCAGLDSTKFESSAVERLLKSSSTNESWKVGEALAASMLARCGCSFPWPVRRDLKNPKASPAGADLVGLHGPDGGDQCRFAFGQVKVSSEDRSPPRCASALADELQDLVDQTGTRDNLVRYFGHRATTSSWSDAFVRATGRYLTSSTDVSLFGVMVRDVRARVTDLAAAAERLAMGCPRDTVIELYAMYLPDRSIPALSHRAALIGEEMT